MEVRSRFWEWGRLTDLHIGTQVWGHDCLGHCACCHLSFEMSVVVPFYRIRAVPTYWSDNGRTDVVLLALTRERLRERDEPHLRGAVVGLPEIPWYTSIHDS